MKLAISLMLLFFISAPVLADTVTYTSTVELEYTDWSELLQLQQFDPALGTFIGAEVALDAGFEGSFFFENMSGAPGSFRGEMDWDMVLTPPGDPALVLFDEFVVEEGDLGPWDGVLDFGGESGVTVPIAADMDPMALFEEESPEFFVGTGTVDLPISAAAFVTLYSYFGSGSSGSSSLAFAELTVTYTYEAEVPAERGSWSELKARF